jgi:hypothetical protein
VRHQQLERPFSFERWMSREREIEQAAQTVHLAARVGLRAQRELRRQGGCVAHGAQHVRRGRAGALQQTAGDEVGQHGVAGAFVFAFAHGDHHALGAQQAVQDAALVQGGQTAQQRTQHRAQLLKGQRAALAHVLGERLSHDVLAGDERAPVRQQAGLVDVGEAAVAQLAQRARRRQQP